MHRLKGPKISRKSLIKVLRLAWTNIFLKVDIFMKMGTKWGQDLASIASGVDQEATFNSKVSKSAQNTP